MRNEQLSVARFSLGADSVLRADGRGAVPHRPGDESIDRGRRRDPPRAGPARRGGAGRRHRVFRHLGSTICHHRHARLACCCCRCSQRNYEAKTARIGPILARRWRRYPDSASGLAVLLGGLAGISISGLLVGGIVPGLILSALLFFGSCASSLLAQPELRAGRTTTVAAAGGL